MVIIYRLLLLKTCLSSFLSRHMSPIELHLQMDVFNELEEEGKI